MKHVKVLSEGRPEKAAAWQDVICQIAEVINAVVAAFGGNAPFAAYIDGKCALPTPNPSDGNP